MSNPHTYQIRVRGHVDARRLRQFAAVKIEHTSDGETTIIGEQFDQAALYALLSRIRDLGLELLALQICSAPTASDDERS